MEKKTVKQKDVIKCIIKTVSSVLAFGLIFAILQILFTPKFFQSSTGMWSNIYSKSVKAQYFFMGSSEMYCSVDSKKLTEEYNIESYDLGSGGQPLFATEYYLKELLKYQTPSHVVIDTATIFRTREDFTDEHITWAYSATRPSLDKIESLNVYHNNYWKSFCDTVFPIFKYHSRWSQLEMEDFGYFLLPVLREMSNAGNNMSFIKELREKTFDNRGYLKNDGVREMHISFNDETVGEDTIIPSISEKHILNICEICAANNIKLLFIKTPTTNWTKKESIITKEFFANLNTSPSFIDFHDYLGEIGIDGKTDFYDSIHLNYSGATKFTDYLAKYIEEKFSD